MLCIQLKEEKQKRSVTLYIKCQQRISKTTKKNAPQRVAKTNKKGFRLLLTDLPFSSPRVCSLRWCSQRYLCVRGPADGMHGSILAAKTAFRHLVIMICSGPFLPLRSIIHYDRKSASNVFVDMPRMTCKAHLESDLLLLPLHLLLSLVMLVSCKVRQSRVLTRYYVQKQSMKNIC